MSNPTETENASVAYFQAVCRERGARVTPQRLEVYRQLAEARDHPSVATICQRVREHLPMVTVDTIYRTLTSLEELGLAKRVSVTGGSARYEACMEPHHHFACSTCGGIFDVELPALRASHLEQGLPEGFQVTSTQVEFRGVCPSCAAGE